MSFADLDFQGLALGELERFLSWQDRERPSRTYGCFDRTFWAWKFTDFAGARFQEGVYALSHLYRHKSEGNSLFGNPQALEWALAGLKFWTGLQYPDGSFDEAYPFEHSLAATAFTSFYCGEAFLLLGRDCPEDLAGTVRAVLAKAGDWLCANDERHGVLSNHLAAAAAALSAIHQVTGQEKHLARCRHFLERIFAKQSSEGWYEEYGGADPGYQTVATFYLACVWKRHPDKELTDSLARSLEFEKWCIHPDRSLGGEYGSRNTEFYFPAGFEILAGALPVAASIAEFMRPSLGARSAAGLPAMDAYNFFPMFNNYLFAQTWGGQPAEAPPQLPCQQDVSRHFPQAGLYVANKKSYYLVAATSKGGVFKLFAKGDRARLARADCGYLAQLAGGSRVSSQNLDHANPARVSDDSLEIDCRFAKLNQRTQTPWTFMAFRLFTLTLGRLPAAAYWVKNLLVKVLVSRRSTVELSLRRVISFQADGLEIADTIEGGAGVRLDWLARGGKFSTIHMGSSRYFQKQELAAASPSVRLPLERTENGLRAAASWRASLNSSEDQA